MVQAMAIMFAFMFVVCNLNYLQRVSLTVYLRSRSNSVCSSARPALAISISLGMSAW